MLMFAQPLFLWGLLALIIPIAIHLLNRKPGPLIEVGNADLYKPSERRRLQGLGVKEWWLLLLRCLVLAAMIVLLAGPQRALTAEDESRRWLLVEPALMGATDSRAEVDAEIATWREQGFELHYLVAGFPETTPSQEETEDLWSLVRDAAWQVGEAGELVVLARGLMRQFNEERPTFATKVTWRFFPSKVSADWTQAAWRNGDDGLRVLRGESTASGLWFSVTNQTNEAVQNDMILPEIAIALEHTPERATDGRYLRLALQAACETAGYRVVWADHEDAQLLVWLSPETIPANWQVQVDQGAWVIADAEGSMRATRGNHVVFEDGNRVAVHHRSAPLNRGEMGLRDAFGSPLLERQGRFFQFHSRFEPDHWPIVLEGSFPLFLGGLLDRAFAPVPMNYSDRRVLPAGQSVTRNGSTQINRREANHASWQLPVFFLLCFCFAAERFLSERSAP